MPESTIPPVAASKKGPVAWMAKNSVAANLLMVVALLGGLLAAFSVKQEVFPEFDLDIINITVPLPGASPAEVEQGIVLVVEEAVRRIDGIKRIRSVASEGVATVQLDLTLDADADEAAAEVKNAIDRIQTFPEQSERPSVAVAQRRNEVVSIFLSGKQTEAALHELAERARYDLLALPEISQVEIQGVRPLEVRIEVSRERLEAHSLTLEEIAQKIRATSIELPAGGLDTRSGELLVRVDDRRRDAAEFADIIVSGTAGGDQLRLGDIATITDGYEDRDEAAFFNGEPMVWVTAFRVGEETPLDVAAAVHRYAEELRREVPEGVRVTIWNDRSKLLRARMDLLRKNAISGLILVLITLGLFLHRRLAFWVALGIPVSFLGAFVFMHSLGVSINMISLFALIVTLGMVVDDAIIVAESIHARRAAGSPPLLAAIEGAREMAVPVTFSILTTVAAFAPLLVVPGVMGKFLSVIPMVVISVLLVSLLESFFVLPAHLAHESGRPTLFSRVLAPLDRLQSAVDGGLQGLIERLYQPFVRRLLVYRYAVVAAGVSSLLVCGALVASGKIPYTFFPRLEGDVIAAGARLPYGVPVEQTEAVALELQAAGLRAAERFGGEEIMRGVFTKVGAGLPNMGGGQGSHLLQTWLELAPSYERDFSSDEFTQAWRDEMPKLSGLSALSIGVPGGPGGGNPVDVRLAHRDTDVLRQASEALEQELRSFSSLEDVDNTYEGGKPQLSFTLRDEAATLGVTSRDVGLALRSAFFGVEAVREQRGRNELKVRVMLPEDQRSSEQDLSELTVAVPGGGYVPLAYVADFTRGQAPTSINREDGRRTVNVSAALAYGHPSPRPVLDSLRQDILPKLEARFPGLETSMGGQQREQQESFATLGPNYLVALLAIYALIAIPFKSYLQPIIVMSAIPFGILGAVLGHVLLGYSLSFISVLGIIALSGVVVNDSLVLVDGINRFRRIGFGSEEQPQPLPLLEAVVAGGMRRFRPILLTSLTTFFGLMPMIFETSFQARFLIPMAISLGFGALFVTVITLLLVPALYLIVEDAIAAAHWMGKAFVYSGDSSGEGPAKA